MIIDKPEYKEIAPFNDAQAMAALREMAQQPIAGKFSKMIFPDDDPGKLSSIIMELKTVDEFQTKVIYHFVKYIINKSIDKLTFSGAENLDKVNGRFLLVSNHRDIILDPAITQVVMFDSGHDTTEIAVGNNLLGDPTIATLMNCNKMVKVIRNGSPRDIYMASANLSRFIRESITSGESSFWIAQREGRAKNGIDTTEQGVLKMFDMSGSGDFAKDFEELNIIPLSISYEYDSCDILKAREKLIAGGGKYVKAPGEDENSIMTGIRQWKGNTHLTIGEPLTKDEIEEAASLTKNERYQHLCHILDGRIRKGYKLWKTNYMAYDMVNGSDKYSEKYTAADKENFKDYVEKSLDKVEPTLDREGLKDLFLHIYSNPVKSAEEL